MWLRAAEVALGSLLAVCTVAAPASGQKSPAPGRDSFWIGAGLGAGSEDFAGSLQGSYQFGVNLLSVRSTITAGLFDDGFGDYALLYGRATRPAGKRHHLSLAAGVGLVHGCRGGGLSDCRDVASVFGLPLEVSGLLASRQPDRDRVLRIRQPQPGAVICRCDPGDAVGTTALATYSTSASLLRPT